MLYHAHWLWHFRWGRWNLIWSYLIIFMFSLFCFAVPNTALNAWWFNNFGITPCVLQFAGDIPKSWPGQTAKHPLTAPKSLSLPNDPLQENKSCVSLLYSTWMMSGDQNMVVNSVCIHILQSLWKFHRRWVDWSCSIHVWYFVVWLVNGFWGLICCAVSTSRSIGKNCHLQMFNLHHVCHPARQFNQCEFNICTVGAGKVRRRQDGWRWLIVLIALFLLHRPLDPLNPTSLVCFGARARGTWGTAKLPQEILLHPMVCSDLFQSSTLC